MLLPFLSAFLLAASIAAQSPSPIALDNTAVINTTNGPIVGFIDPATGVNVFKNIPYGADTSTTRFKNPKSPTSWTEPKKCVEYGNIAPQPWGSNPTGRTQSEDCLNLNVWTRGPPPLYEDERRPVVVYFHGGGYESGTVNDELYDGTILAAKRNAVVVTVNHRINGFGYMYLGGVSEEYKVGNPGQADLILALKWVQDNIEKFGGEKDLVMVFGQSGGGAKCATLMAQPEAKGLFQRVWTMSGQQITGRTKAHAEQTAQEVLAKAGGNVTATQVSTLLKLSTNDLRKAMSGGSGQKWTPVVDGFSLPINPYYPTANEQSKEIPMVIGNTYDETRNLIGSGKPALFNLTWEEVPSALEKNVKFFIGNMTGAEIVAGYRKQYPDYSPSDIFFAASTAARSWKSMLIESEVRAKQTGNQTWVYYLRYKSPYEGGKWGAAHGFDIPLVFSNPDKMKETRGDTLAQQLGDVMSRLITQFAVAGEPGLLPAWKPYRLEERKSLLVGRDLEIVNDDRGWERKFFEKTEYVQPGT
jgi:para-nitrobenzyl esterase